MIKFFRKIRQKTLSENKFGKYLTYAFGEIILVVIGILIALSINNWNEEKKDKDFENEMLAQIQENLANDKKTLKKIKIIFNNAISSSNKILELKKTEENIDSLKYWLADIIQFERFQPITNSYETLKSKGLDKVSNKELRMLLGAYYDDEINHVIKSVGDVEYSFNNDWIPVMKEIIVDFKFQDYIIVSDPNIFNQPSTARNILTLNKDNYRGGLNQVISAINSIDKLEKILEKTLKK
ncbi:hypothetical protein FF125_08220 [Aureibaculum algae]|uniref:Uncharacterized protein n=1 Tax=Aureibaculum algae TaxID=2584122 RepID=A0A5B7TTJ0_9FLAO|nr:DUF6090 family protein [Aureibaculum algae]QCX38416.1 hypothetical protein FF125_08220 [Aureibaculum algae]